MVTRNLRYLRAKKLQRYPNLVFFVTEDYLAAGFEVWFRRANRALFAYNGRPKILSIMEPLVSGATSFLDCLINRKRQAASLCILNPLKQDLPVHAANPPRCIDCNSLSQYFEESHAEVSKSDVTAPARVQRGEQARNAKLLKCHMMWWDSTKFHHHCISKVLFLRTHIHLHNRKL